MRGTVQRVIRDKGFGFIKCEDRVERFFHRSAVRGRAWEDVDEGAACTLDASDGDKGPRAENVTFPD